MAMQINIVMLVIGSEEQWRVPSTHQAVSHVPRSSGCSDSNHSCNTPAAHGLPGQLNEVQQHGSCDIAGLHGSKRVACNMCTTAQPGGCYAPRKPALNRKL
jgi:hypothetical protein